MNEATMGTIPRMILLFLQRMAVKAALVVTPLALMAAPPQQLKQSKGRSLRESPSRIRHHEVIHG